MHYWSALTLSFAALALTSGARADTRASETTKIWRAKSRTQPAPTMLQKRADAGVGLVSLRAPATEGVLVRGGSFTMGSEATEILEAIDLCEAEPLGPRCRVADGTAERQSRFENEVGPHRVTLSDYVLGRREITVAQYRRCVASGPCLSPPLAGGGKRFDKPDFPVTLVTWNDASTYCHWAGGRLPTEAEWERAARGHEGRRFPWGNVYNPFLLNGGRYAIDPLDDRDGFAELAPVGSFPAGRTADGIDDLAGNAAEWVFDFYAPEYPEPDEVNPTGPDTGDERVVRGGSYQNGRAWQRGAYRGRAASGARFTWLGFRCVWAPRKPSEVVGRGAL